jgi:hypothetical protein
MPRGPSARFGIAEWFGRDVRSLSEAERTQWAEEAKKSSPSLPCLPRARSCASDDCPNLIASEHS